MRAVRVLRFLLGGGGKELRRQRKSSRPIICLLQPNDQFGRTNILVGCVLVKLIYFHAYFFVLPWGNWLEINI